METTNWLTKGISEKQLKKEKESAIKKAKRYTARKEKKERKASMRAYRKMYRRHRKELVKLAKTIREWDYGWLYDSTIMQIRHMYEYYTARNNVYQSDESLLSLIDSLKYVLDLDYELEHLWDDHVGGHVVHEDGSISATEESAKSFLDRSKREQELYREVYNHIAHNIMTWWD
jgi:vacuolar-type H+-ATPase subunit E/Vma4